MVHKRMDFAGVDCAALAVLLPHELDSIWKDWRCLLQRNHCYHHRDTRGCPHNLDAQFFPSHKSGLLKNYSIAQKMPWYGSRTTTRKEEMAYFVMGPFNVNMPLLYGEGNNAFTRLQEEIIQRSVDRSIFAWTRPRWDGQAGLLATSPRAITNSDYSMANNSTFLAEPSFALTNRGFEFQDFLIPLTEELQKRYISSYQHNLYLFCLWNAARRYRTPSIVLTKLDQNESYARVTRDPIIELPRLTLRALTGERMAFCVVN